MVRRGRSNIVLALTRAAGVAAVFLLAGCAHWFQSELLPDGSYRVSCKAPLPDCLAQVEELCDRKRYVVVKAVDRHNVTGVNPATLDIRSSEAIVRCGKNFRTPALNEDMTVPEPAPCAPAASSAPTPSRACVPGATQPCVGPAGCSGGQACLADGSGFAPCDCGGAAPDASASGTTHDAPLAK